MRPAIDILQAIADPNILGDRISPAQEAALRAMYGLPMSEQHLAIAKQCTGRAWRQGEEQREGAFICGRRSGKSDKLAANIALYEAFFRDHNLSAGETGVVLLLAQNMRQAKVVKGYIEGKIEKSPILRRHVVANRSQELELDNGITIAIHPASFRAVRGLSVVCCICDEIAFWWTEDSYANPDVEVMRAIRPAMATFPHGKLVIVSSPYTMSGVLWELWRARDVDEDVLVWQAPTKLMNPTVSDRFLARARRQDPDFYEREYEARFVEALSSFLPADAIDDCTIVGRTEDLEPDTYRHTYKGALDAAFKGDRFTFCIGHQGEGDDGRPKIVIDCIRGWEGSRREPIRLSTVIPEIAALCKRYWVSKVYGDQYASAPIGEELRRHGRRLEEVAFTQASKADIYNSLRAKLVDRAIELPDHKELLKELRSLELELMPAGQMRIGHPSRAGAHDDFADAVALLTNQLDKRAFVGVV